VPGDLRGTHRAEIVDPGRGECFGVSLEIPPVRGEGIAGEPTLDRQVIEVGGDGPVEMSQLSTSLSARVRMPCASATDR
jgi:hypothetical protein